MQKPGNRKSNKKIKRIRKVKTKEKTATVEAKAPETLETLEKKKKPVAVKKKVIPPRALLLIKREVRTKKGKFLRMEHILKVIPREEAMEIHQKHMERLSKKKQSEL